MLLPPRHSKWLALSVVIGAVVGIAVGFLLQSLDVHRASAVWIAIPGDLFIRALKGMVVPLVFFTIAIGAFDLIRVKKARQVGLRMTSLILFSSFVAAWEGIMWISIFRTFVLVDQKDTPPSPRARPQLSFECSPSQLLFAQVNGTSRAVGCPKRPPDLKDDGSQPKNLTSFGLVDVNQIFGKTFSDDSSTPGTPLVYQVELLLHSIVPDNVLFAFESPTGLLSVIVVAVVMGALLARHLEQQQQQQHKDKTVFRIPMSLDVAFLRMLLHQLSGVFLALVTLVMKCTPLAVMFILASAIHHPDDDTSDDDSRGSTASSWQNLAYFSLAYLCAALTHLLIFYPLLYVLCTRESPGVYMTHLIPAQVMAFGSASSAVTLPVMMRMVEESGQVHPTLARVILGVTSTVNMDGGAIYFAMAYVYLNPRVELLQLASLSMVATVASVGGAPIPNASLAVMTTVWKLLARGQELPQSFEYLIAIDWLLDRLRTVINVTGDAMLVRIIAHMDNETTLVSPAIPSPDQEETPSDTEAPESPGVDTPRAFKPSPPLLGLC